VVLEQVQQILSGGKHLSIPALVEQIPELTSREEAEEILYLLLRLDKRFEQNKGLWFSKVVEIDSTPKIVAATQAYFDSHPRPGEMTQHLVEAVVKATGEDNERVREVILDTFRSAQSGKMILNKRLKE
jgi:hypothetical protein